MAPTETDLNGHEQAATVGHEQAATVPPFIRISRHLSRSPASKARVAIKNRRKRYLDTHLEYFSSPSLELAGLPFK